MSIYGSKHELFFGKREVYMYYLKNNLAWLHTNRTSRGKFLGWIDINLIAQLQKINKFNNSYLSIFIKS